MKKIIKVIQNEFIKLFQEKIIYVLFFVMLIMLGMGILSCRDGMYQGTYQLQTNFTYSTLFNVSTVNLNGLGFARLSLLDFIYRPFVPFFLVFVGALSARCFAYDYSVGHMKFQLISGITKTQLALGKLGFLFLTILMVVVVNFLLALTIGSSMFGVQNISWQEGIEVLLLYLYGAIPAFAFASIIGILGLIIAHYEITMSIAVGCAIIISTVDGFTSSKYLSPIGGLSMFLKEVPTLSINFDLVTILAFMYSLILCRIILLRINKMEFER